MNARTAVLVALALTSCSVEASGPSLTHERVIASGHYRSQGPRIDELAGFPHGDQPKSMTIDRDAGIVRIEYDRDGEHVAETWRIASSGQITVE